MVPSSLSIWGISLAVGLGYLIYKWMSQREAPHQQENRQPGQNEFNSMNLSEYEQRIAAQLADPQGVQITWNDIAGLNEVISVLRETVILPIQNRQLLERSTPSKGVLLYGPPGCGKTTLARAMSKEAGLNFINMQENTPTDEWFGESQKLVAALFSLAVKLQPTIIFIDEIDSFLRSCSSLDHEATAARKSQFMSLWDEQAKDHHSQVIILGATNRPGDLDPAILRRMPTKIHIKLPNIRQREDILKLILRNEKVDPLINLNSIAEETEGFSGRDLKEMCRVAALLCAQDLFNTVNDTHLDVSIRRINQDDFRKAISKIKENKTK